MALSRNATPEKVREYKRLRMIAWVWIGMDIMVGILGAVVHFEYHSPISIPITLAALVGLVVTGVWANNRGVLN